MKLTNKEKKSLHLLFAAVTRDSHRISSIDFFRVCKLLKIYPTLVPYEKLKRIILKDPVFWKHRESRRESNHKSSQVNSLFCKKK